MSDFAPSAVLRCRQLSIRFGQKNLVRPFDWTVNEGERWAVLGANGAGKTSVLHALLGVPVGEASAQLSAVEMMGSSLAHVSVQTQARRRVWVPQRYEEPFTITVGQALHSIAQSATRDEVVAQLMQFGLQSHAQAWVHQLSGGERQRLTWAMAALRAQLSEGQTRLWLLDEPFSAQDIAWQKRLLQFLCERDGAVVATVHDLNQVWAFATHVLLLGEGGVLAQGLREQVMQPEWLSRAFGVEISLDEEGRVYW